MQDMLAACYPKELMNELSLYCHKVRLCGGQKLSLLFLFPLPVL